MLFGANPGGQRQGLRPIIRVGGQRYGAYPGSPGEYLADAANHQNVNGQNGDFLGQGQYVQGQGGHGDFLGQGQYVQGAGGGQPLSNFGNGSGQGGQGGRPPGGGGKGGKGQGAPSPFDAEYYGNVANYLFKTNNAIAQAGQQQGLDRTALAGGLGQLRTQQPLDQLALMQQANQSGALYSTPYASRQGQLANQYATKQAGLTSSYGGKLTALAQQIAGLRGSVPLYEDEQGILSANRLAALAAKNPSLGEKSGALTTQSKSRGSDAVGRHGGGGHRGGGLIHGGGRPGGVIHGGKGSKLAQRLAARK